MNIRSIVKCMMAVGALMMVSGAAQAVDVT
jgi:hypothetical protein